MNTTNTIAVDYTKVPTTLSSDFDEPVVPQRYRYVIVEGAVSKLYRDDDELELAVAAAQEYEAGIFSMADELMVPNFDSAADMRARAPGS